jgi:hypothetical protein
MARMQQTLPPLAIPVAAPRPAADRRSVPRCRVQMEVIIVPLLDPERRPWFSRPRWGRCRDLTERGMLVGRTGYLPLGALVWLFFLHPDGDAVACCGRVIRHDLWERPRYGIKFVGISLSDSLRIRDLIGERRGRWPGRRSPGAGRARELSAGWR